MHVKHSSDSASDFLVHFVYHSFCVARVNKHFSKAGGIAVHQALFALLIALHGVFFALLGGELEVYYLAGNIEQRNIDVNW